MSKSSQNVTKHTIGGLLALVIVLWLVLFIPAWTIDYWQAWAFWIVFSLSTIAISTFFLKQDLTLIASRLKVGTEEKQNAQKITQAAITISFLLLLLIPSLARHFQWAPIPFYLSVASDFFVALGLLAIFLVFKENSYTSVLVEVKQEQKVISTGPYSKVRHPMYSGALLMLFFIPIALGSLWGLLAFLPILISIAVRIRGEEEFLKRNLGGYSEYCQKVRHRLIPCL